MGTALIIAAIVLAVLIVVIAIAWVAGSPRFAAPAERTPAKVDQMPAWPSEAAAPRPVPVAVTEYVESAPAQTSTAPPAATEQQPGPLDDTRGTTRRGKTAHSAQNQGPLAVRAERPDDVDAVGPVRPVPEFVITHAGEPEAATDEPERKEFAPGLHLDSVARDVLIEAASLVHGLRSAFSEENRARIAYEIKRELIRTKKARKNEIKDALREYRAKHRSPVGGDEPGDPLAAIEPSHRKEQV